MARAARLGFALALLTLVAPSSAASGGAFGFEWMDVEGALGAEVREASILVAGGDDAATGPVSLGTASEVRLPDGRAVRDASLVLLGDAPSLRIETDTGALLESTRARLAANGHTIALRTGPARLAANGALQFELVEGALRVEGDSVAMVRAAGGSPAGLAVTGAVLEASFPEGWTVRLRAGQMDLDVDGAVRMHRAQGTWDGAAVAGTFVRHGAMSLRAVADPGSSDAGPSSPSHGLGDVLSGRLPVHGVARASTVSSVDRPSRVSATLVDHEPAAAAPAEEPRLPVAQVALATVLLLAFGLALKKSKAFAFLAALGSRIRGDEARRHPARERILALLRDHPGMRLAELERHTGMTRNTVEYHLVLLKRCGLIEVQARYGSTRYFLRGHGALGETQLAQAVLRRARLSGEILRAVEERPGVTVSEVSTRLSLHPSHTMYHLRKLLAARLVDARKEGRTRRLYPFGHLAANGASLTSAPGAGA